MAQPRSAVSKSDAFTYRTHTCDARSSVFDTDDQLISLSVRGQANGGMAIVGFPVLDRVLQQRLQEEYRHPRASRTWLHVDIDDQMVSETHALDVEIIVEEGQLGLKRNLVRVFVETAPEERGQPQQHPVSFVALRYERRDGVQCIEEKVRPEL